MSQRDSSVVLELDPELGEKLSDLAARLGRTVPELAVHVLEAYARDEQRSALEEAEDERRWQRYVESGVSVPGDAVQRRLRELAKTHTRSTDSE